MKNKIILGIAAAGTALAMIPLLAAFEAHVVNVTATIENALSVHLETGGIKFNEVFPQETIVLPFQINLSSSFTGQNNTLANEVDYTIRQKPKCGIVNHQSTGANDPTTYSSYPQVTEDNETLVCPNGPLADPEGPLPDPDLSVPLPLLCPYLSKHQIAGEGDVVPLTPPNLRGINSFHGLPGPWNLATTLATAVFGSLNKTGNPADISDTWEIDLHTPCFVGQCAQDWATYVHEQNPQADPLAYQAPADQEHQQFGCDLWVEATAIPQIQQP